LKLRYKRELGDILNYIDGRRLDLKISFLKQEKDDIENMEICYSVFRDIFNRVYGFKLNYLVTRNVSTENKLLALNLAEGGINHLIERLNIVYPDRAEELIKDKKKDLKAIAYWRTLVEQGKL